MRSIFITCLLLLTLGGMTSCSGNGEDEQGAIEKKTEEIGQEAVRMIKTPVDKAQAVADKEARRAEEMAEQQSTD